MPSHQLQSVRYTEAYPILGAVVGGRCQLPTLNRRALSPLLSLLLPLPAAPASSLAMASKDVLDELAFYINPTTPPFLATAATIVLSPLIWNCLARYLHYVTSVLLPSTPRIARYLLCYGMTVWIFGFSTMRDYLFHHTLQTQQPHPGLHAIAALTHPLAYGLYAVGSTLVLSSFYALGLTGTFLGDYVGILMDEPATGFPFNVLSDPMYVGSTMNFFASALLYDSPAGLLLATFVGVVYAIALQFEGPYTAQHLPAEGHGEAEEGQEGAMSGRQRGRGTVKHRRGGDRGGGRAGARCEGR